MEVNSHTRFSWALLGREPASERELLTIYGALLAHGTEMTAKSVSLMIPGVSETAIADSMCLLEDDRRLRTSNDTSVAFMRRHAITRSWGDGTFALITHGSDGTTMIDNLASNLILKGNSETPVTDFAT